MAPCHGVIVGWTTDWNQPCSQEGESPAPNPRKPVWDLKGLMEMSPLFQIATHLLWNNNYFLPSGMKDACGCRRKGFIVQFNQKLQNGTRVSFSFFLLPEPQPSSSGNDEDGINLEEIREFAKNFKIRRLSLGLTQTQVGQALTATEGPAYSQSAICR